MRKQKERKLRILISSNAPWAPSGYAQQMFDFVPLIKEAGFPLGFVAFYGLEGGTIYLDGVKYYPRMGDIWGSDAMVAHQKDFKADIVLSFQDTWVLDPNILKQVKNWIPMAPIDSDPVPQPVFDRLKLAYRVVTHSKFGHDQLQQKGMHSTYIPLLVDTTVYKPLDKVSIREHLHIPQDMFLFGMVSANKDNPPRKSFQEAMDAFALFHKIHPNSGMYFHTLLGQQGGFPIREYAQFLGLEKVIFNIDPYDQLFRVPKEGMAKIYNAFDCLLAPSTNEGFGVPIIEAQSCGIPVITNNFTSMPELIEEGKTGFLCRVAYKRFTPLFSYIGVPDVPSLADQMQNVFVADRKAMGKAARTKMVKQYDTKTVFNNAWIPFFEKVEKEIYKS